MAEPKTQSHKNKRHYPRVLGTKDLGAMAARVWRRPEFEIRSRGFTTEFVFRLRVLERIKRRELPFYKTVFEPARKSWKNALLSAYATALYGNKPAKDTCSNVLYQVFVAALPALVEAAKSSGDEFAPKIQGVPISILQKSKRQTGPRPSKKKKKAKRLARRYAELKGDVSKLRRFIKEKGRGLAEDQLKTEILKQFKADWASFVANGCALKNLPNIPGHEKSVDTLGGLVWTVKQLAVGILVCEENVRNPEAKLRPNKVADYITYGNKLLARAAPRA